MKVLIGTTNPSKVNRFKSLLEGCDIEFLTLSDIGVSSEPEEKGRTPEENAIIKAKYYGKFFDTVITNDSGLYFDCLPFDDPRQPGLNIRTPNGRPRMNDEESIAYYSSLIHSLGGKVTAFYLDGFAVYNNGTVRSFTEDKHDSFYMIDTPSENRHEGWPLDSLSVSKETDLSFVDRKKEKNDKTKENVILGDYRTHLISFLKNSLGIE